MRPMAKSFTALCLLFLVISCADKEKKSTDPVGNTPPDSPNKVNQQPNINPYVIVDVSPMDMSYYPVEYPQMKMKKTIATPPLARVIYSRPHLQGRRLFHGLQKYGEPWRLGANESTELQLYKDVMIQDKNVKTGRYVMYCIPQPDHWTVVLNANIDSWGLEPDSTKDVMRFDIPVIQTSRHLEYYTMVFEKKGDITELVMAWDDIEARLPMQF
jgi:hypothetical protein